MKVLLLFFLIFFPINPYHDPMQVDKPERNPKYNLIIDISAAQKFNKHCSSFMDLDTFIIPRSSLKISITEPDEDFIMLDSDDFQE